MKYLKKFESTFSNIRKRSDLQSTIVDIEWVLEIVENLFQEYIDEYDIQDYFPNVNEGIFYTISIDDNNWKEKRNMDSLSIMQLQILANGSSYDTILDKMVFDMKIGFIPELEKIFKDKFVIEFSRVNSFFYTLTIKVVRTVKDFM